MLYGLHGFLFRLHGYYPKDSASAAGLERANEMSESRGAIISPMQEIKSKKQVKCLSLFNKKGFIISLKSSLIWLLIIGPFLYLWIARMVLFGSTASSQHPKKAFGGSCASDLRSSDLRKSII